AVPTEYAAFVDRSREAWNRIGAWWDVQIGDEGNPATVQTLLPVTERLLDARAGEEILDVACGNGWFSRRIARGGAQVTAVDFSSVFIERAKARTPPGLPVNYLVADATDKSQLLALGRDRFDAVLCSMALMDMAAIEPLFAALRLLMKKEGRFVFSILHPDVEQNRLGNPSSPEFEVGIAGQPTPNLYFHRSLDAILKVAARHGFTLDATEEPGASTLPRFLVVRLR
ncbi:MAG TPA: class I SAM-dependent methyltransferase, partial [Kiritimatiellia bacterium]